MFVTTRRRTNGDMRLQNHDTFSIYSDGKVSSRRMSLRSYRSAKDKSVSSDENNIENSPLLNSLNDDDYTDINLWKKPISASDRRPLQPYSVNTMISCRSNKKLEHSKTKSGVDFGYVKSESRPDECDAFKLIDNNIDGENYIPKSIKNSRKEQKWKSLLPYPRISTSSIRASRGAVRSIGTNNSDSKDGMFPSSTTSADSDEKTTGSVWFNKHNDVVFASIVRSKSNHNPENVNEERTKELSDSGSNKLHRRNRFIFRNRSNVRCTTDTNDYAGGTFLPSPPSGSLSIENTSIPNLRYPKIKSVIVPNNFENVSVSPLTVASCDFKENAVDLHDTRFDSNLHENCIASPVKSESQQTSMKHSASTQITPREIKRASLASALMSNGKVTMDVSHDHSEEHKWIIKSNDRDQNSCLFQTCFADVEEELIFEVDTCTSMNKSSRSALFQMEIDNFGCGMNSIGLNLSPVSAKSDSSDFHSAMSNDIEVSRRILSDVINEECPNLKAAIDEFCSPHDFDWHLSDVADESDHDNVQTEPAQQLCNDNLGEDCDDSYKISKDININQKGEDSARTSPDSADKNLLDWRDGISPDCFQKKKRRRSRTSVEGKSSEEENESPVDNIAEASIVLSSSTGKTALQEQYPRINGGLQLDQTTNDEPKYCASIKYKGSTILTSVVEDQEMLSTVNGLPNVSVADYERVLFQKKQLEEKIRNTVYADFDNKYKTLESVFEELRELRRENKELHARLHETETTHEALQKQMLEVVPSALTKIQQLTDKLQLLQSENELLNKRVDGEI